MAVTPPSGFSRAPDLEVQSAASEWSVLRAWERGADVHGIRCALYLEKAKPLAIDHMFTGLSQSQVEQVEAGTRDLVAIAAFCG